MNPFGDIVDTASSAAASLIPGASLVIDVPWYKTWWGMGLIGVGGIVGIALLFPRKPTYVVVRER